MEGLLEEAESQYSYERQVRPHRVVELTKYLYKYSDLQWTATREQESTLCADTSGLKMTALELPDPTAGSSQVKVENPAYSLIQGKLSVLKAAKTVLEKCASQMLDMKEEMVQKSSKAEHLRRPAQELQEAITKLTPFQDDLRAFCTQAALVTIKDDCRALQDRVQGFIAGAQAHQEGWKAMQKRMKDLLLASAAARGLPAGESSGSIGFWGEGAFAWESKLVLLMLPVFHTGAMSCSVSPHA